MSFFFCKSKGLEVATKLLINAAGVAVAANNKELAASALPVAKGIIEVLDKGIDNDVLNSQLQQALTALVAKTSDNPAIVAALSIALSELKININGDFPKFNNEEIKDMVNSFLTGAEAGLK